MKKVLTAGALALTAIMGMAQTTMDAKGVTTSTDPVKASAVERQAAELKDQQQGQKVASSGTSSSGHAHHHRAHHRRHRHTKTAAK